MTTSGQSKNSQNVRFLSQGDINCCIKNPNQSWQMVKISDFCHNIRFLLYSKMPHCKVGSDYSSIRQSLRFYGTIYGICRLLRNLLTILKTAQSVKQKIWTHTFDGAAFNTCIYKAGVLWTPPDGWFWCLVASLLEYCAYGFFTPRSVPRWNGCIFCRYCRRAVRRYKLSTWLRPCIVINKIDACSVFNWLSTWDRQRPPARMILL